jgi:6-phosphogluconate dehydrogenase
MDLGLVGLGKMGANMTTRLVNGGHRVVAYDRNPDAVRRTEAAGAEGVSSLEAIVGALPPPRAVWLMLPAGAPTESTIAALAERLESGDVIVDGGNTHFNDDIRRAETLGSRGVHYLDAGTSGGIWGLREGYCLMIGGDAAAFNRLEPLFKTLAPPDGYLHVGPAGAGHYVKMVHNGIEYGLMQAYAEGFELMQQSEYDIDLAKVSALWMQGSVVRSWLLELAARALAEDPELATLEAYVEDSGEGRWTLQEAIAHAVPMPVLTAALFTRFRSRQDNPFTERLLAALRRQFGGHAVRAAGSEART